MMKKYKMAILGCGDFPHWNVDSIKKSQQTEVKSLFDPNQKRAESYTEQLSGEVIMRKTIEKVTMSAHLGRMILLLLALASLAQATTIEVSSKVLVPAADYQPLGVNNFGRIGGLNQTFGNLFDHAGFEPARERLLHRVILSGKDQGRYWVTLDGPGTSNYRQNVSGSFSGAKMRAYRFVDAKDQPLPLMDARWAQ